MLHNETILFSWTAQEFEKSTNSKKWHILLAGFFLALIGIGIYLKSPLFSIVMFISYFLMFHMSSHEPKELKVEISESGIQINESFHRFADIDLFSIHQTDENKSSILLLKTKQNINPVIHLDIDPYVNLFDLKDHLSEYVEPGNISIPITTRLTKLIHF